ncbi:YncE family protein [Polaribacter litorisediminis]|uniref:YncE family protein n=1 Tax=Polaribacter litorisediminis TaxID=1908341 RepID=UPI001CBB6C24|nr:beta-propeller fold lactonase family protein [Polaribacter litorisediminis]
MYAALLLFVFIIRLPSYSIQTTGKLYIINKVSRDITVFDLFTGTEIAEIPINIEAHEAITTLDNNHIILTDFGAVDSEGSHLTFINTTTNKVEKTIDLKRKINVNGIVTIPKTNKLVLVDYVRNFLLVLNIDTKRIEKEIQTKQKNSHLVALHPHKPIAYVTNMKSNSVSVMDLKKDEVVKIIPCGLTTESIDITPDGSEIWVTNKNENSITIINTTTNEVVATIPTEKEPLKLKFTIDGAHCLVANASGGSITVYDQASKKRIKTIRIPGRNEIVERILYHTPRPVNILMHPNGIYAFVSNSNANKIEVIDLKTFKIVSRIGTGKVPDALAFLE